MIDVPLLQGLKEYYDYVNLCNELGLKPLSFEEGGWIAHYRKLTFMSLPTKIKGNQ